jgi:hypothetical protein
MPPTKRMPPVTLAEAQRMVSLRRLGVTDRHIADCTGRPLGTVSTVLGGHAGSPAVRALVEAAGLASPRKAPLVTQPETVARMTTHRSGGLRAFWCPVVDLKLLQVRAIRCRQ